MIQVLTCRLGEEMIAVDIRQVQEIHALAPCTPLPLSEPYIKGVVPIRGRLIPVMDLHARFGLKQSLSDHQRLVILDSGETLFAIIVDETKDVGDSRWEPSGSIPEEVRIPQQYLNGLCHINDQTVPLLNPRELLGKSSKSVEHGLAEKAGHF